MDSRCNPCHRDKLLRCSSEWKLRHKHAFQSKQVCVCFHDSGNVPLNSLLLSQKDFRREIGPQHHISSTGNVFFSLIHLYLHMVCVCEFIPNKLNFSLQKSEIGLSVTSYFYQKGNKYFHTLKKVSVTVLTQKLGTVNLI